MPKFYCDVPYHPDPAQPDLPTASQKLYLVTGIGKIGDRPVIQGAYSSWNSSGGSLLPRGVTVKGYELHEHGTMHSAWRAGCNRGEHDHPADPNAVRISVPLPAPGSPLASSSPRASPAVSSAGASLAPALAQCSRWGNMNMPLPAYLWTPEASPTPQSASTPTRSKTKVKMFEKDSTPRRNTSKTPKTIVISSRSPSPAEGSSTSRRPIVRAARHPVVPAPGVQSFAVRSGSQGWLYSDLADARNKYNALINDGLKAEFTMARGFMHALSFVDGEPAPGTEEAARRAAWTAEEARALSDNVAAAQRRREITEELATYRDGESSHSSDESDDRRMTDDLAEELELRGAYGENWRQARKLGKGNALWR
ncbi:hypothetical protein DFH07DRAFT_951613 [Mycena maculata]|uniref:Uncharacterized protein n=1 Tax=Mycena maculata TaxID=230809 RepID=A0AAD7NV74_9AGAR|nr:hypothetical protein DFH07DRAFT_951613 [Mycena maculata]